MALTTTVTASAWHELTPGDAPDLTVVLPAGARFPVMVICAAAAPSAAKTELADGDNALMLTPGQTPHFNATGLTATDRLFARCTEPGCVQQVLVAAKAAT